MLNSENLSPQQEACSQAILTSAQTLLFTINDVLDFSRLESQGIKLENQSFDLVACIEETADMAAVRAHEKNIEIITDLADIQSSHFRVHGDPFRLRQIILNLSNNGKNYSHTIITICIMQSQIQSRKNISTFTSAQKKYFPFQIPKNAKFANYTFQNFTNSIPKKNIPFHPKPQFPLSKKNISKQIHHHI